MKNSWPKFESLQKNIGDERIFLKDLRGLGRAVKKMSKQHSCLRQFFCIEPGSDQCSRNAVPANCECENVLIEDEKHVKNYFRPSVRISFMGMQEEATFRFASVFSLAHTNAKSISKRTPSVVRARNQPK